MITETRSEQENSAETGLIARQEIDPSKIQNPHLRCLEIELQWFSSVLALRLKLHFGQESDNTQHSSPEPPQLPQEAAYARLVAGQRFGRNERLVLMLAMAPHLRPQLLDDLMTINLALNRGFSEFGGWQGKQHGGFLPTCETAAFLVAGVDLEERLRACMLFEPEQPLMALGLLRIKSPGPEEPKLSSLLYMPRETLDRLTGGVAETVAGSKQSLADLITTKLEWSDLVLPDGIKAEIDRIHSWIVFGNTIMNEWGLDKILQPGYRALFHGPPGTGKTLVAGLLGKRINAPVYRIDLSRVVSKYIGETEKNLAGIFDQAGLENQVLFFDEADTLFGKRTTAATVNDRHANQETAFLLQRIENHPGIVILATNLKENIDEAFFRRFQSVIHFPMPNEEQRHTLWKQSLSNAPVESVDLGIIARDYELSGGSITNVIRQGALRALEQGRAAIAQEDLLASLGRNRHEVARAAKQDRPPMMIRGPMNVPASTKTGPVPFNGPYRIPGKIPGKQ